MRTPTTTRDMVPENLRDAVDSEAAATQGLSIFPLPWRERVRVRGAFFGQMTRCLALSPPS